MRKYSESYVQYGFTSIVVEDQIKPQCFLCSKVLCNANMKPSRLKSHMNSLHPDKKAMDLSDLLELKKEFEKKRIGDTRDDLPSKYLEASFKISYSIAKSLKPHTIGESLIKPCLEEATEILFGADAKDEVSKIPISNNVVKSRISSLSDDILNNVIGQINSSRCQFGLQLDESTDVSHTSQLLAFVRYATSTEIIEEFLFCEPLKTTTRAIDIFTILDDFFQKHDLQWSKLGSICTDGCRAMMGSKSGLVALIKQKRPGVKIIHCIIHRYALVCKSLPTYFTSVLNTCVKIINFITSRDLNHRLFKEFCKEVGSEFECLLYHTEVRWLSKGLALSRLYVLRYEVLKFLLDKDNNNLHDEMCSPHFITGLSYLVDIFEKINSINLSLQGHTYLVDASEILTTFQEKLILWRNNVQKGSLSYFPTLRENLEGDNMSQKMKGEVISHLNNLRSSFDKYYTVSDLQCLDWIRNPFVVNMDDIDDLDPCKEELISLRGKKMLYYEFRQLPLDKFWCAMVGNYPIIADTAINSLIPFATTYLCERAFSTLVNMKNEQRNRLNVNEDMRVALAKTLPKYSQVMSSIQSHPSH